MSVLPPQRPPTIRRNYLFLPCSHVDSVRGRGARTATATIGSVVRGVAAVGKTVEELWHGCAGRRRPGHGVGVLCVQESLG